MWKSGSGGGWKVGRLEEGRLEGWKSGSVEEWKCGRVEVWKWGKVCKVFGHVCCMNHGGHGGGFLGPSGCFWYVVCITQTESRMNVLQMNAQSRMNVLQRRTI